MGAWFPGFSGFSSQGLIVCRCSKNVTFEAGSFVGVSSVKNRKRNCTSHQGVPRNGPWKRLAWTQRTLGEIPVALESARTPLGRRQPSGLLLFFVVVVFFWSDKLWSVSWYLTKKFQFQELWNFGVIVREEKANHSEAQCYSARLAGRGSLHGLFQEFW